MSAILRGKELFLTGCVSTHGMDSDAFSSVDILLVLDEVPTTDTITVHVNSVGGDATEGAAIYAMLASRQGRVDIVIDGIAASAASLIAMAGETISMSAGSVLMIHDPSGFTFGNSAEHGKTIEALEKLATAYAGIYARKSGKTASECRAIMKAETWFTPQEAIEAGFADKETQTKAPAMVAAFDYSKFKRAPQQLVALASEKKWTASQVPSHTTHPGKDPRMTKDNQAHAAATARIKAIMKADEADGRAELAEHLAYDTDLMPDEAIALMKTAPKSSKSDNNEVEYQPRRLNAQGLNNPSWPGAARPRMEGEGRLVTSMKQRYGAK